MIAWYNILGSSTVAKCSHTNFTSWLKRYRTGGNGTVGTIMAVPVLWGKKWRRLDSNLPCLPVWPLWAVRRGLGSLRGTFSSLQVGSLRSTFSSLQASKVSMRALRLSGHFWKLGSTASESLPTETTGGEILVAFWPKHGLRSDLRVPNFKTFSWGSMPPDPSSLFKLVTIFNGTSIKAFMVYRYYL